MKTNAVILGLGDYSAANDTREIEITMATKLTATGFTYTFQPDHCTFSAQGYKVTLTPKRANVEKGEKIVHCTVKTSFKMAQCAKLSFPMVLVRCVFNLPKKIVLVEFIQALTVS